MAKAFLGFVLAFCCCASAAYGQTVTATLVGDVSDVSGALVPGAQVRVTEEKTGVMRSTKSDSVGAYSLPYLPPGSYRMELESPGMKKVSRSGVEVTGGATVRVDFRLEPGNLTEVVQVTAESPVLQTERGDISKTFDSKAATELPLIDRNYQALASLLPGVGEPVDELYQEDPMQNTFVNVNGQSYTGNNTMVDGVDNLDPLLGLTIYIPPAEAVDEVNITTNSYSAEYGRSGGAVINVLTKSGTNQLHGSLFEYNRVTALQARNLFNTVDQPKPNLIRNEFGGTVGGPIRKDKTFFFGSYQGRYVRQAATQSGTLPIDAWRQGNLGSDVGLTTLYDPATGNSDGTGRQPFAGNIIPGNRINPIAAKILTYVPQPNLSGTQNNQDMNVPSTYDGNSIDGRVDHNLSDTSKLFFKFNQSLFHIVNSSLMGPEIGDGIIANDATTTGIVGYTHGFSPTLLSEVRAGYNRYWVKVDPANTLTNPDAGIQVPEANDTSGQGLARIYINGMNGIGGSTNYPLRNADNLFSLINNWTKILPKHTLKFGVELVRIRADRFQPEGLDFGPRGLFQFTSSTSALNGGPAVNDEFGGAFASFLLGTPDESSRTYMTITPTNRQTQFAGFVQDAWQVSSKLTLNLGLRYDLYTAMQPRYPGGASNYDPANNTLLIAGVGGVGLNTNVDTQKKNFGPRLGFAYRLNPKSVIRGGYGISYWVGNSGFNGGSLSTQFPVIYNIQNGVTGDYIPAGSLNSIPSVSLISVPSNGILSPAPDQGYFTIPKDYKVPRVHSFNLTLEREVMPGMTVTAAYVGSLGRDLPYYKELNYALPGGGSAGQMLFQEFGRTSSTTQLDSGLSNSYHSLQLSANKRFAHGLSFTTAYTWSKAMDYGSDQAWFYINAYLNRNYGPADFDRTHQVTVSHIYELPFGKGHTFLQHGAAAMLLGGWQVNGIFRAQTGTPFSMLTDPTSCNCPGNNGNFADAISAVKYPHGLGPNSLWFDPSAFAAPAPNMFGNAGRNLLRGPGWWNYDASIFRRFPIKERAKIEFRAEFNNLTNTPHWGMPVNSISSPNAGEIFYATGQRQIQSAARITF